MVASRPEGGSVGGRRKRRKIQSTKDRYAHAREDAQLEGLIPTTPEEALKPERVSPSAQSEQALPDLIAQAIRRGWAVDEEKKPRLVDEMVQIVLNENMSPKAKIAAFNALRMGDEHQHGRDHPKKPDDRGQTVNLNVLNVLNLDTLSNEQLDALQSVARLLDSGNAPGTISAIGVRPEDRAAEVQA